MFYSKITGTGIIIYEASIDGIYFCVSKINISKNRLFFTHLAHNPPADGVDLTMKGTLNAMFDYCYIPLGTYLKLSAQAGFRSSFEKSP